MTNLRDDLEALRRQHDGAVGPMREGFSGASRDGFDGRFGQRMGDIGTLINALNGDLSEIGQELSNAHARLDQHNADMNAWNQAAANYNQYQVDNPPVAAP